MLLRTNNNSIYAVIRNSYFLFSSLFDILLDSECLNRPSVTVVDIGRRFLTRAHFISDVAVEVLEHFPARIEGLFTWIMDLCFHLSLEGARRSREIKDFSTSSTRQITAKKATR